MHAGLAFCVEIYRDARLKEGEDQEYRSHTVWASASPWRLCNLTAEGHLEWRHGRARIRKRHPSLSYCIAMVQ